LNGPSVNLCPFRQVTRSGFTHELSINSPSGTQRIHQNQDLYPPKRLRLSVSPAASHPAE
jgi:hypothetical protein